MANVHIGMIERRWPTSAGVTKTAIWYPSKPAAPGEAYLDLYPAGAAGGATPLPGRYPLVMLESGTGGHRYSYSYLGESLAAQGFWVVAPETSGVMPGYYWRELWWRPHLVRQVLVALLCSDLSGWIDSERVISVSHSSGSFVSLVLAGASPDFSYSDQFAPGSVQARLDVGHYPGIDLKAMVLLDPALSSVFPPSELQAISMPTALLYSEIEDADLRGPVSHYRAHLGNLRMCHCVAQAGHYVYCNVCPPLVAKVAPHICNDKHVDRKSVHHTLTRMIADFLAPWR